MIRRVDGVEIGADDVAAVSQAVVFVVRVDDGDVVFRLCKSREIGKIFRVRVGDPIPFGNDVVSRISKIAVIAAAKNAGTLYPPAQIRVAEIARPAERKRTDVLDVRDFVVFKSRGRGRV